MFLVVAWVGLWYPLDLLFIAREQAKQRRVGVLGKMLTLPVVVRAHDHTLPAATVFAAPARQGLPLSLRGPIRRFVGVNQFLSFFFLRLLLYVRDPVGVAERPGLLPR